MSKKRKAKDWRKERQDPRVFKMMEYAMLALACICAVGTTGYYISRHWAWYLLAAVCVAAAVVLDIVLPQYFTLIPAVRGEKKQAWDLEIVPVIHGIILLIMPWKNWTNGSVFWIVFVLCGAALAALLGRFAEEFRREKEYLILVFIIGGFLGTFMTGHINEAFALKEPESYTLTVESVYGQNRGRTVRSCTVTMPDGTQMELNISKSTCDALEVGGPVRVEVGTGALGIEYANAYAVE